jgi:riboflavin kinase/FMN adenylyltransferase
MQVHNDIDKLPHFTNSVITIGTFDGIHSGHHAILDQLIQEGHKHEGESVVITFHPHPRKIIRAGEAPSLLTSIDERIALFQKKGIDHLVIVPFDLNFAELSAEEYIDKFLVHYFHPKAIVIGFDHRYGKNRAGDYALLKSKENIHGYEVIEIPEFILNNSKISSTHIRKALLAGEVEIANSLLGYDYQLEGIVIRGDQLGRKIGFPTANLAITETEKLIPATGVYAVSVFIKKANSIIEKNGMMNIGYRPTVSGKERRIEIHLFNLNEDLYDLSLCVKLKSFIRNEIKFSGLEELTAQLEKDQKTVIAFFDVQSK